MRDFDDRGNNFDKIKELLMSDIEMIWGEIYKPEKYQSSKPEDFFYFEYHMLPHKLYEEEKFIKEVKELSLRFDVGSKNTLFPSVESKNIPMDGLPIFLETCWTRIREQKELNLVNRRSIDPYAARREGDGLDVPLQRDSIRGNG